MKNEIQIDLQPVQTRRASEEIYNQIRQLILDGEIHPGERLPSERKMMVWCIAVGRRSGRLCVCWSGKVILRFIPGSSGAVVQEVNVDNAVQSLETIFQMKHMKIEEILEFVVWRSVRRQDLLLSVVLQKIWRRWKRFCSVPRMFLGSRTHSLPVIWSFIWHWQMHHITQCIPLWCRCAEMWSENLYPIFW